MYTLEVQDYVKHGLLGYRSRVQECFLYFGGTEHRSWTCTGHRSWPFYSCDFWGFTSSI